MTTQPLYRQGDIFIQRVDKLPKPEDRQAANRRILVHGESTGHTHSIKDSRTAKVYHFTNWRWGDLQVRPQWYLDVTAEKAEVVHPEHGTITLPKGVYIVWRQREWGPNGDRNIAD